MSVEGRANLGPEDRSGLRVETWERDGQVGRKVVDRVRRNERDEVGMHRHAAASKIEMVGLLADVGRLHRNIGDHYPDVEDRAYGAGSRSLEPTSGSTEGSVVEGAITELGPRARAQTAASEITRQVKAAVKSLERALDQIEKVQGATLADQRSIKEAADRVRRRR